jgi:hypothetical protein
MVMRRVYYSYVLSFFSQVVFWQGMFLGVAALLLAKWLHVAKIIDNFLSVPVGHAPQYVLNAITGAWVHGEVLMVSTFVVAGMVALSAGYHLMQAIAPRLPILRTNLQ